MAKRDRQGHLQQASILSKGQKCGVVTFQTFDLYVCMCDTAMQEWKRLSWYHSFVMHIL